MTFHPLHLEAPSVCSPPEGAPLPEVDKREAFRTVRIKVAGTDRVLQLGTMAAAHVPGTQPFLLDQKNAAEFPNYRVAEMVREILERRLNAAGGATWSLRVVPTVHEQTETWNAAHRFDRTALETAYLLADSLPSWVKRGAR